MGGDLGAIAWSSEGQTLFAAGRGLADGGKPIFAWSPSGARISRILPAAQDVVTSLRPLPAGDLLIATGDPWFGRLRPEGTAWAHDPPNADFRNQSDKLSVSMTGLGSASVSAPSASCRRGSI